MQRFGKTVKISLVIVLVFCIVLGTVVWIKGPSFFGSLRESMTWAFAKPISQCSSDDFTLEAKILQTSLAQKGSADFVVSVAAKRTTKYSIAHDGLMWTDGTVTLSGRNSGEKRLFHVINNEGFSEWEDGVFSPWNADILSRGIIPTTQKQVGSIYLNWPQGLVPDEYDWVFEIYFFGNPLSADGSFTVVAD